MVLVDKNSLTRRCPFAGVALDSADGKDIAIIKKQGKVKALEEEIFCRKYRLKFSNLRDHLGRAMALVVVSRKKK